MDRVYFDIPPMEHRLWPGTYSIGFDHYGGRMKWSVITLSNGDPWHYVLHPSPWLLMRIAGKLIYLRARRFLRK